MMDQDQEKIIDKNYLNEIRNERFRPCVIGAIICNGLVALFKNNKIPGYLFVQGGIEMWETPLEALEREVVEELGYWFYKGCEFPPAKSGFLLERRMESKNVKSKITGSDGQVFKPIGKHYLVYFIDITKGQPLPQIKEDDYNFEGSTVCFSWVKWASYEEEKKLVSGMDNKIKIEIALSALDIIHERGYLK